MSLQKDDIPQMVLLLKKIECEYKERVRLFHDLIRLNFQMLLIELQRRYKGKNDMTSLMKFQENQLHRMEGLIDEHYKDHHSVLFYADKMNLSIKQLNTLCKKSMNKTLGDLVQERLILEAKRLLVHSDYSISTIGQLLNYSDNSYFARIFKKATDMSPEQFRLSKYALFHTA
jgi:AraC-like DNA-binding protein